MTPINATPEISPKPATRWSRRLMVSIGLSIAGFLMLCVLGLYAFMLNVDLSEAKRRLSKEVELRQQTERYLVETRNQLNQSLLEIAQLKTQLEFRQAEFPPPSALKPPMPVVIHFRSSFLGRGIVAVLENTSERDLTVVMNVRNPTLANLRRFTLELPPHSSANFGHLEGWQFASGDELVLFHNDFNALRLVVP